MAQLPLIEDGIKDRDLGQNYPSYSDQWLPAQAYDYMAIADLVPGPCKVKLTASVVNIYDHGVAKTMPESAKGCLKVLVKDGTEAMMIHLWYAEITYNLFLGTLLTVFATHIHSTSSTCDTLALSHVPPAALLVSIFPERDKGCHVRIHREDHSLGRLHKTPIGHISGHSLQGLISLADFFSRGSAISEARVLVCVTVIGPEKIFISKIGKATRCLSLEICDHSLSASLSLYGAIVDSALTWTAKETTLLISKAQCRSGNCLGTTKRTMLELNPDIDEAQCLRRYVQRVSYPINAVFPSDVFSKPSRLSPQGVRFTLASLSEFIIATPSTAFTGYLPVLLGATNLVTLYQQGRLFCMDCCGVPVFDNTETATCFQCHRDILLRVSPALIGELADETGSISSNSKHQIGASPGKLPSPRKITSSESGETSKAHSAIIWSDKAWTQLLGMAPAAFAIEVSGVEGGSDQTIMERLRYLEQRLQWMRVVLRIGWTGEYGGGRLAVLEVVQ